MNRRERLTISAVLLMAAACLLPAFARADAGEQDEAHWWNRYLTPGTGSAYQYPMLRAEFGEGAVDAETGFGIPAREIQYGRRKAQAVSFKSYGLRFVPYAEGGGASTDYLAHYSMSNGWTTIHHTHWHDWSDVTTADVTPPKGSLDFMGMWAWLTDADWVMGLHGKHPGERVTAAAELGFDASDRQHVDGTPATGLEDFFRATAAKNYLGEVHREDPPFAADSSLNATVPDEIIPLIPAFFDNPVDNNPSGKHSLLPVSKDVAAPVWIKYGNTIARYYIEEYEADGVHYDNLSGWNALSQNPKDRAFGDWSIKGFQAYLAAHPGIYDGDPKAFDMRRYVQDTVAAGRSFRSKEWLNDPIWRAFLIHKREEITCFLNGLHDYIKDLGDETGRDLAMMGNASPFGTSGVLSARNVDACGFEISPGVGPGGHPFHGRGCKLPPYGRACAFYQAMNALVAGRFNYPWYYVGKDYVGKPNLSKVLFYEGLANDSILMPRLRTTSGAAGFTNRAGTRETVIETNAFIQTARELWGERRRAANIAIAFSAQSQLAVQTPHMYSEWDHVQGVLGWATYCANTHRQYEIVRLEEVDADYLTGIDLLVVPHADVCGPAQVEPIARWVREGGRLIVTGDAGNRDDAAHNWDPLPEYSFAHLTGVRAGEGPAFAARKIGSGRVIYIGENCAQRYYLDIDDYGASRGDAGKDSMDRAMAGAEVLPREVLPCTSADLLVGARVFRDTKAGNLQIDLHSYDVDPATDAHKASAPVEVGIMLPDELAGGPVRACLVSPDVSGYTQPLTAQQLERNGSMLTVDIGTVDFFKTLFIEADERPPRVLVTCPLAEEVIVAPQGRSVKVNVAWKLCGSRPLASLEYSLHPAGVAGSFRQVAADTRSLDLIVQEDGHYVFEIRAIDESGQAGPTTARRFWTDNSAPISEVTVAPAEGETVVLPEGLDKLPMTFGYNAFDPSGISRFETDVQPSRRSPRLRALPNPIQNSFGRPMGPGEWTLTVRATDTNGYTGPLTTRTFRVVKPGEE